MWSKSAVWKQYNKMAVLHFFLVNSTLIYILFSMVAPQGWGWGRRGLRIGILELIKIFIFHHAESKDTSWTNDFFILMHRLDKRACFKPWFVNNISRNNWHNYLQYANFLQDGMSNNPYICFAWVSRCLFVCFPKP